MREPSPKARAVAAVGRKMPNPLWMLVGARVRIFWRDPASLFWVFAFPVILALVLGTAFRDRPPEPVKVGIPSDEPGAARLVELLTGGDDLEVVQGTRAELEHKLGKGAVDLVAALDESSTKAPGTATAARYHWDPQRSEGRLARLVVERDLGRALGQRSEVTIAEATDMPAGRRYIDFLLPGLIGMNLLGSSLWGVGYGMVQERGKKLMRRFATTPLTRSQFLLSFVLSRLVFLTVEVAFLVGFGAAVFGVDIQGSVALYFGVSLAGVLCFTGFGVLCASRTESVEVVSGFINALTMPMWLLSGTFFSYERFPEALHPVIQLLPLTALNDALRAITNEGAGLVEVLPQIGVLGVWGLIAFGLGVRLFRWR